MLFPKQSRFKKSYSRKKITTSHKQPDTFAIGDFCVVAKEPGRLTGRQLESLRRFLRRKLKKQARIWIRIFPSTAITKKPLGVRLGKGKSSVKYWACSVRQGQILAEIKGCNVSLAKNSVLPAVLKLSLRTSFLNKGTRWIL